MDIVQKYNSFNGTSCSLVVVVTDKKQVYVQRYFIMVIGFPSLNASKVILFHAGISALEKRVLG
jgi:hypothetical protein